MWKLGGRIGLWGLSCLASLIIVQLYIFQFPLVRQINLRIYDELLKHSTYSPPSQGIAIVDIDEKSLQTLGQWPWPRYRLAQLLERLDEIGAAAVGLDVLLAEPDRTSPERIQGSLRDDLGLAVTFEGLPRALSDNDAYFAEVLAKKPVVLGTKLDYTRETPPLPGQQEHGLSSIVMAKADAISPQETIFKAKGLISPLPIFVENASLGMIDVAPDMDGVIRAVPLVSMVGDTLYANLGLRTLLRAIESRQLLLRGDGYGLQEVHIRDLGVSVPVSPSGMAYIPFKGGARTYSYYSAVDVLEGKVGLEELSDRIVFIGSSAAGLLDMRATPYTSVYPGVEVHATTVDAVLNQEFICVPAWTPAAQLSAIIATGLLCGFFFSQAGFIVYFGAGGALTAGAVGLSQWLWSQGIFFTPTYIILTVALQVLFLATFRFWLSERQKKRIQTIFGLYVAPEVVDSIVASGKNYFRGEECDITVMFTDIRKFTSIAEKLTPEQVVDLLNCYFTPMTAIIRDTKGTLDKFIGDALMAFWNAPVAVDNHSAVAVEAALRIKESLKSVNRELQKLFGLSLKMGIGLHTGSVYVGNMGSEELIEYTIIGDSVNVASRLESMSSYYGLTIVVSESIRKAAPEAGVYIHIDDVILKGKTEPIAIYTVVRPQEAQERAEELARFADAKAALNRGAKDIASEAFEFLSQQYPEHAALYASFGERIRGAGK